MAIKYSYSKLNTFDRCGWRYYLTYIKGHYIYSDSIQTELGTLIHFVEESIGRSIKEGKAVDYAKMKDDFLHINIPKKDKYDNKGGVYGIEILKKKYPLQAVTPNDNGQSYMTKTQDYLQYGIYRLEHYFKKHPALEIYDLEKYFSISFGDNVLSGYIDRIFRNKQTGEYIIEDIKTKDKPFKEEELITPMQFVIYALGLRTIVGQDAEISCAYDLPICDVKQPAGTKGFVDRGEKHIKKILADIDNGKYEPAPSPLCAWCPFSETNEEQPEEGKDLCPYHSLWTRGNKTRAVAHKWEGISKHAKVMERIRAERLKQELGIDFDF